ncbi:unnamed protein product [Adineta ricciae]|uniref:G-protein coupled receptors family 1 profile domain-containing protein n=1 Tax=Adineta ricciae TaxID=249248 RepID=A0A813P3M5_ADIRI|nr:unnamed protein product [Adineta ricciae]CAF0931193.1 unnamed protein product [Adineta ricciae]
MPWPRKTDNRPFQTVELVFAGVIPIILIIIGTMGNFLCIFCILCRQRRRGRSTYIYFIFLFLSDTLSLYQWNLNYIIMEFNDRIQLSDQSLFLCRSIAFLSFYTLHLSALFLTLIAIDRTLILRSKFYRTHMTKRHHALIISIVIILLLFLLDGFLLSLGVRDERTDQIVCYQSFNTNIMFFYDKIYPWIHLVVMYITPFVIMTLGIVLIIIKLYNRRINLQSNHQKQRLCFMLIGMCAVYMMLTLPNRLCFSVFFSRISNQEYGDIILLGSNTLLYTRNATNVFFLYLGSSTFRKQLAKFYSCFHCSMPQCSNRIIPVQLFHCETKSDLS